VLFSVVADTSPGDEVRVVGSIGQLGNWVPSAGLSMATGPDSYPTWSSFVKVNGACKEVEYKFVRLKADGNCDWEGLCLNRRLVLATAIKNEIGSGVKASKRPPRFGEPGKMEESPFEAKGRDSDAASRPSSPQRSRSPPDLPPIVVDAASEPAPAAAQATEIEIEALCRRTAPGDVLVAIGSIPSVGSWTPDRALVLATSAATFPKWNGIVKLQGVKTFEFKLAIRRANGGHDWENTSNRRVVIPSQQEPGDKLLVKVAFEGPVKNHEDVTVKKPLSRRSESQPDPASRPTTAKEPPHTSRERGTKEQGATALVAQRCASTSNLFMDIGAPAGTMWSNLDMAFGRRMSPGNEENLTLRLPEIVDAEAAAGLDVAVVLESNGKALPMTFQREDIVWTIALEKLGISAGIYCFYFLVEGTRVLCPYFPVFNDCNAALLSSSLRRYIVSREAGPEHAGLTTSDSFDDGVGKNLGKRAYSIAHNLNDVGDDHEYLPSRNAAMIFKPEVFEGLFDVELKLRLDGFTLPKMPVAPPERVKLWSGAHVLKKACGPCEDAFFIGPNAVGVADGVGCMVQFQDYGVNAAAYAAELMEHSLQWLQAGHAKEGSPESGPIERAQGAMRAAETSTQSYGASTIIVLVAEGGEVGVANLGDSGFMILRKGPQGFMVAEQSDEQQHSWNCPYQLTRLPPALAAKFPRLNLDSTNDCLVYTHLVRRGDLLLLFSDGLRDNLHDREILHIADCALSPTFAELIGMVDHATAPEVLAKALAMAAHERSLDLTAKTPFTDNARKHGYDCLGGKQDDITVVASWVLPQEPAPEHSVEKVTATAFKRIIDETKIKKQNEAALALKNAALAKAAPQPMLPEPISNQMAKPPIAPTSPTTVTNGADILAASDGTNEIAQVRESSRRSDNEAGKRSDSIGKASRGLSRALGDMSQSEAGDARAAPPPMAPEAKPPFAPTAPTTIASVGDVTATGNDGTNDSAQVRERSREADSEAGKRSDSVGKANSRLSRAFGDVPPTEANGDAASALKEPLAVPVVGRLHNSSTRINGGSLRASMPPYEAGRAEVSRRRRADYRPVSSKARQ